MKGTFGSLGACSSSNASLDSTSLPLKGSKCHRGRRPASWCTVERWHRDQVWLSINIQNKVISPSGSSTYSWELSFRTMSRLWETVWGRETSEEPSKKGWSRKKRDSQEPARIPPVVDVADGRDDRSSFRWRRQHQSRTKRSTDKHRKSASKRDMHDDGCQDSRATVSSMLRDSRQRWVVYHQFGDTATQSLQVEETPPDSTYLEPLSNNHVVIKVQASTISLNDCLNRRGMCFDILDPVCLPATPGYDLVGNIIACGSQVRDFKVGDRVAALVRTGGNARFAHVPASSLIPVAASLDAAEAVCMVSIYTTAYKVLRQVSDHNTTFSLQGKKVLIIHGLDAVGQALIQMCRKANARVYVTAPQNRHAYMRNVLQAIPLPDSPVEWTKIAQDEMDLTFDGVCGDLEATKLTLREGGKMVCYGFSSLLHEEMGLFGAPLSAHLRKWQKQSDAPIVDIWESFSEDPETYKRNVQALLQLLKLGKIRPHVTKRVSLAEVAECQERIESGEARGISVCLPWKRVPKSTITQAQDE